MVPRTELVCLDVEATVQQAVHTFAAHAFSRVPVFEGTQDRIIGMLHTRDLLVATAIKRPINLRQLLREALFVPDTQRADELLKQLRAKREHLAIVLDEYGGTAGLVTMTDLVSRIVGDIDEPGQGEPDILHTADGGAQLNGLTSIGDLNEAFDLDVKDDNYDTIGGLIMGRLDRIPKVGDMVELKAGSNVLALTVEEMDRLRVAKVRLTRRIEA
jgi:CBS domain containing-hemolysin-like protein